MALGPYQRTPEELLRWKLGLLSGAIGKSSLLEHEGKLLDRTALKQTRVW